MMANSPMSWTVSNGDFLSDEIGGTSIVFGSPTFISQLPQATELHLDGTFKVRPSVPPSRQMLTVMSMHLSHVSVISVFNSLLQMLSRLPFSVFSLSIYCLSSYYSCKIYAQFKLKVTTMRIIIHKKYKFL